MKERNKKNRQPQREEKESSPVIDSTHPVKKASPRR